MNDRKRTGGQGGGLLYGGPLLSDDIIPCGGSKARAISCAGLAEQQVKEWLTQRFRETLPDTEAVRAAIPGVLARIKEARFEDPQADIDVDEDGRVTVRMLRLDSDVWIDLVVEG